MICPTYRQKQWCNRQGGRLPPPQDFWPGNFCWPIRKREARKKRENGEKRRKIEKGKVEIWKCMEEKLQNEGRTFFFFLPFFFFLLFTFKNHWNLFWVNQNGNFLPGKSISCQEKIRKNDFAPSEQFSCYTPGQK